MLLVDSFPSLLYIDAVKADKRDKEFVNKEAENSFADPEKGTNNKKSEKSLLVLIKFLQQAKER